MTLIRSPLIACLAALLAMGAPVAGLTAQRPTPGPTTVKGRVVDPEGRPLAAAVVTFGPTATQPTKALLAKAEVQTDAEGRFAQLVTPTGDPGDFQVVVALRDRAALLLSGHPTWDNDKKAYPAERDLGDIVLIPGQRLFGRVRDPNGKPVPGARVVAKDAFESVQAFRSGSLPLFCAAETDASGIFDLPCALDQAVRIEVSLDGHHQAVRMPVSAGTPLEIELRPSGHIAGRVLDAEGRGVEGAAVTVDYEVRTARDQVKTGPDGSFRITLAWPSRYRIGARKQVDKTWHSGRSGVLEGPRANLELQLEAPEKKAAGAAGTLRVQAIDQATRQPVAKFVAVAAFEQYVNQNANYREHRLRGMRRGVEPVTEGTATVEGPGPNGSTTGVIQVVAEGYAPGLLADYQWQDVAEGQERPPAVIELVAESTLGGTIVDEGTGEPVAGARVWARLQQDRSQGYYNEGDGVPEDAVTTAADGTFTLRGLGEGAHEITVRHKDRPKGPPATATLKAREQQQGFVLKVPAGATVAGRLVNGQIGRGWKVFLQELPDFSPQWSGGGRTYYGNSYQPPGAIEPQADGSFEFTGQKLCDYRLMLQVPSPPRCGGALFVPIEPFRLRRGGLRADFDIGQDRPGRVRGTVTFPKAGLPFDRVLVTARPIADDQQQVFFSPYQNDWSGPRAFVDRGGAFELLLGPGRYAMEAVDLASGIRLGSTTDPVVITAGGEAQRDLVFPLFDVIVKLEPEKPGPVAVCDRMEVRIAAKDQNQNIQMFGGNDHYDFGTGFALEPGQTEVRFAVPASDLVILLRNNVSALRSDDQRHNLPPLARGELEVVEKQERADARFETTIKLPAPPEIPGEEADQDKGDKKQAGDDGVVDEAGGKD